MRKGPFVLALLPLFLFAQEEKDVWEPLKLFIGSWEGTGKGCPGVCSVEREYQFILKSKENFFK